MTVAAHTPALIFDTIDEAIRAVRSGGMRLSTPRRLMLEALFTVDGPVSAVHLAHKLSIDESSVYRNLEVLESHGLIRHVHLGHGPGLYVLVGRHEVEYLYCERCAKVSAVAPHQLDPVREAIRDQFGYEARFTHFAIVGLCQQCAGRTSSAEPRRPSALADDPPGRNRDPDSSEPRPEPSGGHEHLHSHGDHVHSHPHPHDAVRSGHRP